MKTTRSSDGTTIAYDTAGSGPRLVLVDGALCTRRIGPGKGLARLLAEHFTVINYGRRGRGDSGDAVEYAIEREVEDLEAVIETAGGNTFVFGQSSGAVLALHAAARLPQITRLAAYEAPSSSTTPARRPDPSTTRRSPNCSPAGSAAPAVRLFLELVGLPAVLVAGMRLTPLWPRLKAVAHTLPYDSLITVEHQQGQPLSPDRWAPVRQRTPCSAGAIAMRGCETRCRHSPTPSPRDTPHAGRPDAQPATQDRRARASAVLSRRARTRQGASRRGRPPGGNLNETVVIRRLRLRWAEHERERADGVKSDRVAALLVSPGPAARAAAGRGLPRSGGRRAHGKASAFACQRASR